MKLSARPPDSVLSYAGRLTQQRGGEPDRPPAPDAVSFVLATATTLRSAAAE